ncbi:MAG: diguanylate cyclase, partial [Bacteroidales bacterium]
MTSRISTMVQCQEYGAGAIVLKSLFEEQIVSNNPVLEHDKGMYFWYNDSLEYIRSISPYDGLNEYLGLIQEAKKEVSIPVIASINCISEKGWVEFAKKIEQSGADALELNIAMLPYNASVKNEQIRDLHASIVHSVCKTVSIPVSVKVSQYYTNI